MSRRFIGVAACVGIAASACVSIGSQSTVRGSLVRSEGPPPKRVQRIEVNEYEIATLFDVDEACGSFRLTYSQEREQQVKRRIKVLLITGAIMSSISATATLLWAADVIPRDSGPPIPIFGTGGTIGGLVLLGFGSKVPYKTERLPLATTEIVNVEKCESQKQVVADVHMTVELDRIVASGTTLSNGRIAIAAAVADVLAQYHSAQREPGTLSRAAEQRLRDFREGKPVDLTLVANDVRLTHSVTLDKLNEYTRRRWSEQVSRALTGELAMRWNACLAATFNIGDQIDCYVNPRAASHRFERLEGELERTTDGYAHTTVVYGSRDTRFEAHLALARGTDWHVVVIDGDGDIVESDFTARGDRHVLSGTWKQFGEHAIVITSPTKGHVNGLFVRSVTERPTEPKLTKLYLWDWLESLDSTDTLDSDDRFVDHYEVAEKAGEYAIVVRSPDCTPDVRVVPLGGAPSPQFQTLVWPGKLDANARTYAPTVVESRLTVPADSARYDFQVRSGPGESNWCRYEISASRLSGEGE